MKNIRGIFGGELQLDIQRVGEREWLVVDTMYNYGDPTEVELGVSEIDELIKQLEKAKEVLSRGRDTDE